MALSWQWHFCYTNNNKIHKTTKTKKMKKLNNIKLALIALTLVFATACSKNSSEHALINPTTEQQNATASIQGRVELVDLDGNKLSDHSGILISANNGSFTTTTDQSGQFTLKAIPFGQYQISYSKTGYGSGLFASINHQTTAQQFTLIEKTALMNQVSNIQVTSLQIKDMSNEPGIAALIDLGIASGSVSIKPVFFNNNNQQKAFRLFFSTNQQVDAKQYQAVKKIFVSGLNDNANNYQFTTTELEKMGFKKGQTVYVNAFGDGNVDDQFTHPENGTTVFPSLAATGSGVSSFQVPNK